MSFNKRYITEENIRMIADSNNYERFYNYFKSNAVITLDNFSTDIYDQMSKLTINDKDSIINIMNKCKSHES